MNEDTSTHPICSPWLLMFYGILLVKDALIVSQKNTLSLYWSNWNRLGGLCYFATRGPGSLIPLFIYELHSTSNNSQIFERV